MFEIARSIFSSQKSGRRSRTQRPFKGTESLEVRSLLTALTWSDLTNLTISFAPDGTDIAANKNELNAELNQLATPKEWQATIVSAFQTWFDDLGFSITVVGDSGAKFGTIGATHGDSRFGDVRVGAIPLTDNVLATAIPQNEFISGTWAGDMMLNSTNELKTLDELYALSLHEAGHILGLEHSTDPNSPMFDHGGTIVLPPTAKDRESLKNLYGLGAGNDGSTESDDDGNDNRKHPERISGVGANGMYPRFEVSGTVTDASDVDTYVFRASDITSEDPQVTTIIFRTETPGLAGQITLLTSTGRKVESKIIANGNGLIILQTRDLEADQDYLVQVKSSTANTKWSHGDYQLAITFSESSPVIEQLARGKLDRQKTSQSFDLYSAKSQLFNFQLATDASQKSSRAAVVLSVYDAKKHLIFRAAARPGDTVTNNTVLLGRGKYDIVVEAVAASKKFLPEIDFHVRGSVISTDAGPLPNNPASKPSTTANPDFPYVYPNNVRSKRPVIVQTPVVAVKPVYAPITWKQTTTIFPWL